MKGVPKANQNSIFLFFGVRQICQKSVRPYIAHFFVVFKDAAGDRANKIFRELDTNGDGELDENEFVQGCLDDGELMSLLNSGGLSAINTDSDT